MTIVNEDGSSTAANRIHTLTGQNLILYSGDSYVTMSYDGTDLRWIVENYNDGGPVLPSGGYAPNYVTYVLGASFGQVAGDIATFTVPLPTGVTNYLVNNIRIANATATLSSTVISLYTGSGGTGTQIITSTATTVTSSLAGGTNSAQIIVPTSASTIMYNAANLYVHVTTSTSGAGAADIILQITPLY
jgi:hypothetical protein